MSRTAADLLLLLIALVWGGSFVVVRDSLRQIPPFLLIGGRFTLAFAALGLIFPRRLRAWRGHLGAGLLLALPLLGGFALQTLGLRYTTASASFAAIAACGLAIHLLFAEGGFTSALRTGWPALLYLGLAATGFAFLVQTVAQRHTPPVDTAVVLTTEPLFTA